MFQLSPAPAPSIWALRVLHRFSGEADGGGPVPGLVQTIGGTIFGAALKGGAYGSGVVFRLDPASNGQSWAFKVAHAISPGEGAGALGPLVADPQGGLYVLSSGGADPQGVCGSDCRTLLRVVP